MDIKQLTPDTYEQQYSAFSSRQADIQTSFPGIITAYNVAQNTVTVQPIIQGVKYNSNGITAENVSLPLLLDCPILYPSSGGVTITTPIAVNDECVVFFSSRCIDAFWELSGLSNGRVTPRPQLELRMHDLSDGYIIPCRISQPMQINNISTSQLEIRSNDGNAIISINPTTHVININSTGTINVTSSGNTTIHAPTLQINANVNVNGTISASGDITGNGTSLHSHTHTSTIPGTHTSGPN